MSLIKSIRPATVAVAILICQPAIAEVSATKLEQANTMNGMLHEAVASVCMINAGITVDLEMQALANARRSFAEAVQTFEAAGDQSDLDDIRAAWAPLDGAISMILAGDTPAQYVQPIKGGQQALSVEIETARSDAEFAYLSAADVAMADMLTLELAERQSVLIQQIKLLACEINTGTAGAGAIEELDAIIRVYENTQDALSNGLPDVGIQAPSDYGVVQTLAASEYDWKSVQPILDRVVASGNVTRQDLAGLRLRMDALDARMVALVDVYQTPVSTAVPRVALLDE